MAQPTPLDCCLRKCIQGDLDTSMSRVEVRTFDSGATDEERQSMEVCWLEDNEAVFHDICWKALLDSVRSDNPFTLSRLEKELLKEAAKSAEYCDSYQKVQYECSRVARMLKSANYAVMFTGRRHPPLSLSLCVCMYDTVCLSVSQYTLLTLLFSV